MTSERSAYFAAYRPEMDGLRAIACLIVLIGHATQMSWAPSRDFLSGVPKIGVWLFFVLSAFLLTLRLGSRPATARNLSHYVYGRALRIFPAFTIAVLFYFSIGQVGLHSWQDAWAVLTLRQGAGHLWTIPAEVYFYLLLPFLVTLASVGRRFGGTSGAVLLLTATLAGGAVFWPPSMTPENSINPMWYLVTFGSGVMAAVASQSQARLLQTQWLLPTSIGAICAFVVAMKAGELVVPGGIMTMHWAFGPLWAIAVFGLYVGRGFWTRVLSSRALVWIGEASFSIYLFHWAFSVWLSSLPPLVAVPAVTVASVLVGRIGYRFIELPIYNLRQVSNRRLVPITRGEPA